MGERGISRARPDELVCMDSSLEGAGFELLVRGRVKLVVAPLDAPGCLGRVGRRSDPAAAIGG